MEFFVAIAMLCQATPGTTSTGNGYLYPPGEVRNSQAACQQRLLKCAIKHAPLSHGDDDAIEKCILSGVVFDGKEKP